MPRGLPASPHERRLAVAVPDHDLEHAGYTDADKGIADEGWWEQDDADDRRLVCTLHGRAGAVRYALVRTARAGGRDWLLLRTKEQP